MLWLLFHLRRFSQLFVELIARLHLFIKIMLLIYPNMAIKKYKPNQHLLIFYLKNYEDQNKEFYIKMMSQMQIYSRDLDLKLKFRFKIVKKKGFLNIFNKNHKMMYFHRLLNQIYKADLCMAGHKQILCLFFQKMDNTYQHLSTPLL